MTVGKSNRGRKPKGSRVPISAKVPTDLMPILKAEAADKGMPLTDYVALVLAEAHGQPAPSYLEKNKNQEALPIGA